ncbi:POK9 protein, partial [Onychorhynchus coronatus]|nr:POK9 protein [Onychorhynchus coronatus]
KKPCLSGKLEAGRKIARPGPSNKYSPRQSISDLFAATAGSEGLDLASNRAIDITSTAVVLIPMGVWGPLGQGIHALLIGHSSTTRMGLFVLPGVIDSDSHSEIQIMAWTPMPPCQIPEGQQLAQLIPFFSASPPGEGERGYGAFGSTGEPQIFWAKTISAAQPMMTCHTDEHKFEGLVDTGADISIVKDTEWPSDWPTVFPASTIQGVGGMQRPRQSAQLHTVVGPEGQTAKITHFVAPILCTLWGRDILGQFGTVM